MRNTRRCVIPARFGGLACVLALGVWLMAALPAPAQAPAEATEQPWRIASLLDDAGLQGRFILHLDFSADGTAWLATFDGLYAYDGYRWRRYGAEDGLPSNRVRCVLVDRHDLLWIGTDRGIVTFDGTAFRAVPGSEQMAGQSVRRITEAADGSLWFSSDSWLDPDAPSGLSVLSDGSWNTFTVEEGLPSNYVSDFFEDAAGNRFVLTKSGLAQWDGTRWTQALATRYEDARDTYFWSIAEVPALGVVAATEQAFFIFRDNSWRRRPNDIPRLTLPKLLATRDGALLSATHGQPKRFLTWRTDGFVPATGDMSYAHIPEMLAEAPDGSVWMVGYDLLVRWQRTGSEWTAFEDLPPLRVADTRGRLWFGDDRRTVRHAEDHWQTLPPLLSEAAPGIDGTVWSWHQGQILHHTEAGVSRFGPQQTGLAAVAGFFLDSRRRAVFYGTRADGRLGHARFDSTWHQHPLRVEGLEGQIVSAVPGLAEDAWFLVRSSAPDQWHVIHHGDTASTVLQAPRNTSSSPPALYRDHEGSLWIYGHLGLYRLDEGAWTHIDGLPGNTVTALAEVGGQLWVSCIGIAGGRGGLARFADGAWTSFAADVSGLRSSAYHAEPGELLFNGNDALYIVTGRAEDTPLRFPLPTTGTIHAAHRDAERQIWVDIGGGIFRFRPDGVPPQTHLAATAEALVEDEPMPVRFEAGEQGRPSQAGVYQFSWRLDGGAWSPFSEAAEAALPVPAVGRHWLEVRARDVGFDLDPSPARYDFVVRPLPLQQQWWFWPALASLFTLILTLGAIALASRQRLVKYADVLEAEVARRTADLRQSETLHRSLVENMPDRIAELDLGGNVLFVNRRDTSEEEEEGGFYFSDTHRQRAEAAIQRTKTLGEISPYDYTFLRDGWPQWWSGRVVPVHEGNRLEKLLIIESDVTARHRAEERARVAQRRLLLREQEEKERIERELVKARAKLIGQTRLATIGQMAASIAHELRNPLGAARNANFLLQRRLGEALVAPLLKYFRIIDTEISVADRIISDLLEMSRPKDPAATTVNVEKAAREAFARIEVAEGILLSIKALDPDPFLVYADALQLQQVFVNLFTNAAQAMESHGLIEITATRNGASDLIQIRDDGPGIPEALRHNIFEPLFTTKAKGTGLGLTICRQIIERHGGTFILAEDGLAGTVFQIMLPRRETPDAHAEPDALPPAP